MLFSKLSYVNIQAYNSEGHIKLSDFSEKDGAQATYMPSTCFTELNPQLSHNFLERSSLLRKMGCLLRNTSILFIKKMNKELIQHLKLIYVYTHTYTHIYNI